jgi:hypothetical protein
MRLLSLVAAFGLVLLSGCGKSSPPPPSNPPLELTLTCGAYNAGASVGVVLAFAFDPVPVAAVALPVAGDGAQRTVTCPAGQRVCTVAWADLTALSQQANHHWVVSTDLGRGPQAWGCNVDPSALLPQPSGTAAFETGQVRVSWQPVTGAVRYRATLRGLGFATGAAPQELATASTTGTEVVLPFTGTAPGLAVVELEAWAMDPASPPGGAVTKQDLRRSMRAIPLATGPITLKQPSDFAGSSLDLHVAEGQRLAVILLNVTWQDRVPATIMATGTGTYPPVAPRLAALDGGPHGPRCAIGQVSRPPLARRVQPPMPMAQLAAVAPAATRSFCVWRADASGADLGYEIRPAHLGKESSTASFYLDDRIAGEFTAADWDAAASRWEASQARVVAISGAPLDLDGNGRTTIVFTDAFGPYWLGYAQQGPGPADTTAGCSANTPHLFDGGEIIYALAPSAMRDPDGLTLPVSDALRMLDYLFPHEFNHLVDFAHESTWTGDAWYETWMLEGRAELMTDLVGHGIQDELVRRWRAYIFQRGAPESYDDLSLTSWEGKNVAYASVHLLFRYLADRLGDPFIPALYHGEGTGMALLEKASGLPFPLMYGLWTSSLLFSNEPASPGSLLDYTGADWTPLHQKFQPFQYAPLDPGTAVALTLRSTGFDVYVTGPAGAGGGTVSVGSTAAEKPWVVAIPFAGELTTAP